jgi:plasmid stabilization system protein ParE
VQGSQLCATPFGIDVVGLTVAVALVGAAVGGYTARQRKAEAEKLNEQLRKINASLRRQTRAGRLHSGLLLLLLLLFSVFLHQSPYYPSVYYQYH